MPLPAERRKAADMVDETAKQAATGWLGWGHAVGHDTLSNEELEQRFGLTPGWIEQRTGFRSRRYASLQQATSDLAIEAARQALAGSGVSIGDISLVLLATSTPDHLLPGTAPMLAARLGSSAPAFDLMAACSGFVYGLLTADHWVRSSGRPVLLIGANVLSRRVNPDDLQTSILFGDAAGAIVLGPTSGSGIMAVTGHSDGEHMGQLMIPAGGSRLPWHPEILAADRYMQMPSGQAVFKLAVEAMLADCEVALREARIGPDDIDWLVAHQASRRIVAELGKRLAISPERVAWWLAELGNSSAATIPVALSLGRQEGLIRPGQTLLLAAAGAGFCSAASVIRV